MKAKVARQSGRLEVLHSIRPDLRMLKQLGREVQEAEVKINQFEKALKGLQRVVEVEEQRSIKELVLELMEVGEEVQVVDSLQRKVEQVEEKLVELGVKVMECKAGARSLEAVRKEAEDVSWMQIDYQYTLAINT